MTVTDIRLQNSLSEIIPIGAMENDYVLDSVDWGVASISAYPIVYFPVENSERILNTTWQPRPVSIIGWVIGSDEVDIEAKSRRLEAFIGLQTDLKILHNGFHLVFRATQYVKFANTERENNEVLCKFLIVGVALDPRWHDDSTIESKNFHAVPAFFFPLYFTPDEPRVVFGRQYSNVGSGNNRFAIPKFNFPLILNEEIPAAVFGELYQSTENIIDYDGVLSQGMVFRLISNGVIRNLTIELEHNNTIQTFSLTVEYPANTEIIIDTREGIRTVTVGGVDHTADVAAGSVWFRLRPGISIFTYFFNGDGQLDVVIDKKEKQIFEVQT